MEDRLLVLNERIMAGMKYAQSLTPNEQLAIHNVLAMQAGRPPIVQQGSQEPVDPAVGAADKEAVAAELAKMKASGEAIEGGKGVSIARTPKAKLEEVEWPSPKPPRF